MEYKLTTCHRYLTRPISPKKNFFPGNFNISLELSITLKRVDVPNFPNFPPEIVSHPLPLRPSSATTTLHSEPRNTVFPRFCPDSSPIRINYLLRRYVDGGGVIPPYRPLSYKTCMFIDYRRHYDTSPLRPYFLLLLLHHGVHASILATFLSFTLEHAFFPFLNPLFFSL